MFGVAVVMLKEEYVQLPPQDGTIIMRYGAGRKLWSSGWQGVQPAPKDLENNKLFERFTVVIIFIYLDYVKKICSLLCLSLEVV